MNTPKRLIAIVSTLMAAGLLSTANAAEEQSTESKMKVEDAKQGMKMKDATDKVDEVITNRKLRAETGSKSKYSVSSSFNYQGGTVEKPLAAERPNITAGSNTEATAALTGSVAARMRLGKMDYLKAGVGLRMDQPLQQTEDGRKDVYDPYLTYGLIHNTFGLQNSFSASLTGYTRETSRDLGYLGALGISNTAIKSFKNGLSAGIYLSAGVIGFDNDDKALQRFQADYYGGVYPFIEYVINDTFNLRTISGVWVYEHYRGQDAYTFSKNTIYQSFGLGISVTRDVFLYPNIQIIPEDVRADRTNVAMSATINMF